ncbi:LIC_12616 family protein [Apilactobacillus apinorum]|uniref:phage neck terminator protein n=1 Tax=Apilactobacillus apinorum TaxID=1218495 RepID=UPI0006B5F4A0|nr:hypothetical protein [Apilactobacillus apinorum]KOY69003.1 hypothetical protein RZ74_08030 [Apilactobacillus apinorum]CAI2679493.1 Hypothetical protein AAPFHON13_08530 [Apilactobacillus apinorum]
MSDSVSTFVARVLIEQIKKYKDIDVVQNNIAGRRPNYPYFAIDVPDPFIQVDFDPVSDHFNLKVQIKAVTDDQKQYYSLLSYIQRLFFMQQPTYELKKQGIGVINIEANPSTASYIENMTIYDGGYDLTLDVRHHEEDFTQGGILKDARLNYKEE